MGFSGRQAKPTPGSRPVCALSWDLQAAKGPGSVGRDHAMGGGFGDEAVVPSTSTGLGPPNCLSFSPLAVPSQGHGSIKGKTAPIPPRGAGGSGAPGPVPIEPARLWAWVCWCHVDLATHRTGHLGKLWLGRYHGHRADLLDMNEGGSQAHAHAASRARGIGLPLRVRLLRPRRLWGCLLCLRGLGAASFGTVNLQGLYL